MWSDRDLNLFKDDLSDLINEEKLNHSAKSSTQKVLKTCQQAVDKLVEETFAPILLAELESLK